jgi:alpha-glucosidase
MEKSSNQEPWSFGENCEKISKKYINMRYKLLLYYYTQVYISSKSGIPLIRPLFLEFENDKECYNKKWENTQFFMGDSLLIIPILEKGQTKREFYLPKGLFF